MTAHAERLAQVEREVQATMARGPHVLPDAWSDAGAIGRMGEWISRFIPIADRPTFRYGVQS